MTQWNNENWGKSMPLFLRKSNFTGDWDLISRIWLLRFDSFAKISNSVNMKFHLEDKFGRYSLLLTWSSKKWKFGIKNRENRLCLSELGAGGRGHCPPLYFYESVNLMSTREHRLCPPICNLLTRIFRPFYGPKWNRQFPSGQSPADFL